MMAERHKGRLLGAGRGRGPQRRRKRRYLVVTNGEVTEPEYLRGLESELDDVVVEIRPVRRDPAGLAKYAKDLVGKERMANSGRGVDGFRRTFVITDVDEFTVRSFQNADRICKDSGIELIISNPCVEVWLIDYEMVCPEGFTQTRIVEHKAKQIGLVGGAGDKNIESLLDSMTRTLRTGRLCRFRRSGTSRSRTMSFIAGKGARRHKGTGGPT